MHYRLLYSLIPVLLFVGYAIAVASNTATPKITLVDSVSDTLFIWSKPLSATTLSLSSNVDLSNATLASSCDISSRLFSRELNIYTFVLRYNTPDCLSDIIVLKDTSGAIIENSQIKLNVYSDFELYDRFVDYSSPALEKILRSLKSKIKKTEIFVTATQAAGESKLDFYAKKIRHFQYKYNADIIETILTYRQHKYIVPVEWKTISTKLSHLPNALRPYRASYTDGIHHGWDVSGEKWEMTIALDNGIITRVVSDFTQKNFADIVYWDNLSEQQKLDNLDVLRGNQVWLKTMKGDVVFYSHLGDVSVEVWDIVFAGAPIGTIDSTGVPGADYHDYHLHFPVHKNPYNSNRAGTYSYDEIMKWPWYFKGRSASYIREHQSDVFK